MTGKRSPRRKAILVGAQNYDQSAFTPLSCAASDAYGLADTLVRKLGWSHEEIVLLARKPDPDLRRKLRYADFKVDGPPTRDNLMNHIRAVTREHWLYGDTILFFFAGHGQSLDEAEKHSFLLIPEDGKRRPTMDLMESSVPLKTLLLAMNEEGVMPAQRIFWFDCCRTIGRSGGGRAAEASTFTRDIGKVITSGLETGMRQEAGDCAFLFGCEPQKMANESGEEGHGLFTRALLDVLSGEDFASGDGSHDRLKELVLSRVKELVKQPEWSRFDQRPWGDCPGNAPVVPILKGGKVVNLRLRPKTQSSRKQKSSKRKNAGMAGEKIGSWEVIDGKSQVYVAYVEGRERILGPFVRFPEGLYRIGDERNPNTRPIVEVYLDSFLIEWKPVTASDYLAAKSGKRFWDVLSAVRVESGRNPEASKQPDLGLSPLLARRPQCGVQLYEAMAFARTLEFRVPTEFELEVALSDRSRLVSGQDGMDIPDAESVLHAVRTFNNGMLYEGSPGLEGISAAGLRHQVSMVSEWSLSVYEQNFSRFFGNAGWVGDTHVNPGRKVDISENARYTVRGGGSGVESRKSLKPGETRPMVSFRRAISYRAVSH